MRSVATLTYCDIRYSQAKAILRLAYESYVLFCAQNLLNGMKSNLRGKPWKIHDQSGIVENVRFDFKGNLLESKRQFSQEYKQTIDWEANPAMENEEFVSTTEYDAFNRATSIHTPRNSGEIIPAYDEGGLLKTVKAKLRGAAQETEFVTGISYNPKGQRERITYGNGATTKYEYDEKTFRLTRLLTTRGSGTDALQDLNYEYDQMGNITKITDDAQQTIFFNGQVVSPSQEFEYDALYRLTKATGREHASINADSEPETEGYNQAQLSPEDSSAMRLYQRQWQYDQVGNILALIHQANGNSWTRNYNYDNTSNRLMSTEVGNADVNYTYNEHGSMASMQHLQTMTWDFAERLSHITRGTTEAYYNYDASGQRVRKTVEKGNVVEERLYLGGVEIWRKKVNGSIDTERETLHIMDYAGQNKKQMPELEKDILENSIGDKSDKEQRAPQIVEEMRRIAIVETKTYENGTQIANPIPVQRYQLSNNIESATLELDEGANIISYEEYYPYGDTSYQAGRNASEVSQKRYRYTGKEKDEESGLYYHGARYYACWLGRWTSVDPGGLVDGVNLYIYCNGNPVNSIDQSGLEMIVVSGSEFDGKRYKYNFIEPAIKNLTEFQSAHKDEDVTWLVSASGYSADDLGKFQDVADYSGVNLVTFGNATELQNYINSKSTSQQNLSDNRKNDQITNFALFAHGISRTVELGFNQSNRDDLRLDTNWIGGISSDAFNNPNSDFYSCNTGTNGDNSFAQHWVNLTGGKTMAVVDGATNYRNMNKGNLLNTFDRLYYGSFSPYGSHNYPVAGDFPARFMIFNKK